jgi:integrase
MVLPDGSTALRRSELSALRWDDVDFEQQLVRVTHSIVRNVEGDVKTAGSKKPVPLPTMVIEELTRWKATSPYRTRRDFLFPSIQKNGKQPLSPDMILRNQIRPALHRLGIKRKSAGTHSAMALQICCGGTALT